MGKKFQVPTLGGLRKVIKVPDQAATSTTIAGFEGKSLSIAQLKVLLGLASPTGGSSGGSTSASLNVGQGLSGGGALVGAVALGLAAPIPAFIFGDDGGGDGGDSTPIPGQQGRPGAAGAAGPAAPLVGVYMGLLEDGADGDIGPPGPAGQTGPQGPAGSGGSGSAVGMMFIPEDTPPEFDVMIPGPRGATGPQGPTGSGGSGSSVGMMMILEDAIADLDLVPGPKGNTGATGPQGPAGSGGSSVGMMWIPEDTPPEFDVMIPGPAGKSGSGGSLTLTDGTNTVTGTTSITVAGGTVGGTTPNATLTITGGSSNITPDTHPAAPTAQDDEFESGTAINTSLWTAFNSQAGNATTVGSGSLVWSPSSTAVSGTVCGYTQPIVGSTWEYTMQTKMMADQTTSGRVGLLLAGASGATGPLSILMVYNCITAYIQNWSNATTFTGNVSSSNVLVGGDALQQPNLVYMKVRWDGSLMYFYVSITGIVGTYQLVGGSGCTLSTLGLSAVPTLIGFQCSQATNYTVIFMSDWFRKTA